MVFTVTNDSSTAVTLSGTVSFIHFIQNRQSLAGTPAVGAQDL